MTKVDHLVRFVDLPGIHIRYDDNLYLHIIFDGLDIQIGIVFLGLYALDDGGKAFRSLLSGAIHRRYLDTRGQDKADRFCNMMAGKIYKKLSRLPQTAVWLLHYS